MTPDQLQQITNGMTPGPWADNYTASGYVLHGLEEICSPVRQEFAATDEFAIIALRNHASALIECARLLGKAAPLIPTMSPHGMTCGNHALGLHRLRLRIDAALKRLEEIK
jgi:hypothetical protein